MNHIEQRETDARVQKAWDAGFGFGFWIGAVLSGIVAGIAVWMVAGFCFQP